MVSDKLALLELLLYEEALKVDKRRKPGKKSADVGFVIRTHAESKRNIQKREMRVLEKCFKIGYYVVDLLANFCLCRRIYYPVVL